MTDPSDLTGKVRAYWDTDAATYDHSADHGPGSLTGPAAWSRGGGDGRRRARGPGGGPRGR